MFYKNTSCSVKTFYGVNFKPGDIKEVPGYINDRQMVVAEKPVANQPKPSSEKTKKSSEKSEIIPPEPEEIAHDKDNDNKTSSSKV